MSKSNYTSNLLLDDIPEALAEGLKSILEYYPQISFPALIRFTPTTQCRGYRIAHEANSITVEYASTADAFRAVGSLICGETSPGDILAEESPFHDLGVMLDVSRNGVLTVERLKKLLCQFALNGINSVQLYMEDVYQLPNEPLFGYARGAYTSNELQYLDNFADRFGIEIIPCIQTLGHLEQVLKWPSYASMVDVPGVLLAADSHTYELIEKMLDTVASCFRSRRVHIGMDEAIGVGEGRYRKLNGERRPFDVLNEHLTRVVDLCRDRGLHPLMWSDMYFRIGSASHDYYDKAAKIPKEVAASIPNDVVLVYWDYYHTDPAFYIDWIERHRALGKDPMFALGAWTWGRFHAHLPHAFATLDAGMSAARKCDVGEVFITMWGDDCNECDPASALVPILHYTECAYTGSANMTRVANRLAKLCGLNYESFRLASALDCPPEVGQPSESIANFAKWTFWHDPVLSFLRDHLPSSIQRHFHDVAEDIGALSSTARDMHHRHAVHLARALAGKVELHQNASQSFQARNIPEMNRLLTDILPTTLREIENAWDTHREIWYQWYKPFGWEVIDRRYAGVIARLKSLEKMLRTSVANPDQDFQELELQSFAPFQPLPIHETYFTHAQSITPSYWC